MKKKIIHKNQVVITTLAFLIAIAGYISYDKSVDTSGSSEATTVSADDTLGDGEYDIVFTDDTESVITSGSADMTADSDVATSALTDGDAATGSDAALRSSDDSAATNSDVASSGSADNDGSGTDVASATSDGNADEGEESEEEESINAGEAVLTSTVTSTTDYASQIRLNREQVRSKYMETLTDIIDNESLTDEQKQDAVTQLAEMTAIADAEAEAEALLEAKGFENVVVSITDETCDVVLDMGEVTDAKLSQVEDVVKKKTGVEAENITITAINTQEETTIESVD